MILWDRGVTCNFIQPLHWALVYLDLYVFMWVWYVMCVCVYVCVCEWAGLFLEIPPLLQDSLVAQTVNNLPEM